MALPALIPTFDGRMTVPDVLMTEDDGSIFTTDGIWMFKRQPLGYERLKAVWGLVAGGEMRRLLRSRKAVRGTWTRGWKDLPSVPGMTPERLAQHREMAVWRTQVWITAACIAPNSRRVRTRWPRNPDDGDSLVIVPGVIDCRFWMLLLELHRFIRDDLSSRDAQYWDVTRSLFGTFPELFCYLVTLCDERLSSMDGLPPRGP